MNPFKPTAGKMPPVLIGRKSIIEDFSEALENGAGAPGRLMLITGQRGFGKTVMLTELSKLAKEHGWFVINETASSGLCERLIAELSSEKNINTQVELNPSISIPVLASIQLGNANYSNKKENTKGALALRRAIEERLRKVAKGKGVMFAIDEAQAASREDMVALATTVQHVIRDEDAKNLTDSEKKGVAFVFAGLPSMIDELVNDEVLTFLRRSLKRELLPIPVLDVAYAYVQVVARVGKTISEDNALFAAKGARGYPYMIQLVGYYMWKAAQRRGSNEIAACDVEQGIQDSVVVFGDAVCAPEYNGLTSAQREFVNVMAPDFPNASKMQDIAKRAGKSASWANKYRASLLHAKIIVSAGKGLVAFDIPYFGEYVQQALSDRALGWCSFDRSSESERVTYVLIDDTNAEESVTEVSVRDEQKAIVVLRDLIEAGYEGKELLEKFRSQLES